MIPLKVLPILAIGALAITSMGLLDSFLELDNDFNQHGEDDAKKLLTKMKVTQNELARLSDLKELNDKREATGQVQKTELRVNDIEVNQYISHLEQELTRLTKKYNELKKTSGKPKRKK